MNTSPSKVQQGRDLHDAKATKPASPDQKVQAGRDLYDQQRQHKPVNRSTPIRSH